MAKMHTRAKRKKGLTSGVSHSNKGNASKGERTFGTKAGAEAWAKEHDISEYTIESAKRGRRFKIVEG